MKKNGLAFASLGQNRIIWALIDAINHVHEYYLSQPLIDADTFLKKYNSLDLPSFGATKGGWLNFLDIFDNAKFRKLEDAFGEILASLHTALEVFLPLGGNKKADRGHVIKIYYSIFGFSRGAAEARVFANWFLWLCQFDARLSNRDGVTLGTIPVTFDFMGLFDTVASVGLASSAPVPGAHGHYGWADTEHSLRLPEVPPSNCLHLVSGHELRRSFPLDSIMYKNNCPANCTEVVMPGVHSDVGGGYLPKEQGRGKDPQGEDMLSRIPLSMMYRRARLAGVPLKLEEAPDAVKRSFRISPKLIDTFNSYVRACSEPVVPEKEAAPEQPLHEIMAKQHELYIQWRKKMIGNMAALQSVIDSDSCDREDILAADKELGHEMQLFEDWRRWKAAGRTESDKQTPFSWPEWSAIGKYWDAPAPPAAVTDLFDNYVHDSRAWFKPFGKDAVDLLAEMEKLAMRDEQIVEWQKHPVGPEPAPLSKEEYNRVTRFRPYRNTAAACTAAGFVSDGREGNLLHGGFLRYRKVYMGSDGYKPTGAEYVMATPVLEQPCEEERSDAQVGQAA